jgi:hypothetical protein
LEHIPSIKSINCLSLLILNIGHHKKEVRNILINNDITGERFGLIVAYNKHACWGIKEENTKLWEKYNDKEKNVVGIVRALPR